MNSFAMILKQQFFFVLKCYIEVAEDVNTLFKRSPMQRDQLSSSDGSPGCPHDDEHGRQHREEYEGQVDEDWAHQPPFF